MGLVVPLGISLASESGHKYSTRSGPHGRALREMTRDRDAWLSETERIPRTDTCTITTDNIVTKKNNHNATNTTIVPFAIQKSVTVSYSTHPFSPRR